MHRADGIHDSGSETAGLLASALRTITDPFEIINALPDAILVPRRHDLLRRFAFPFELIKCCGIVASACMVRDASLTVC